MTSIPPPKRHTQPKNIDFYDFIKQWKPVVKCLKEKIKFNLIKTKNEKKKINLVWSWMGKERQVTCKPFPFYE